MENYGEFSIQLNTKIIFLNHNKKLKIYLFLINHYFRIRGTKFNLDGCCQLIGLITDHFVFFLQLLG